MVSWASLATAAETRYAIIAYLVYMFLYRIKKETKKQKK